MLNFQELTNILHDMQGSVIYDPTPAARAMVSAWDIHANEGYTCNHEYSCLNGLMFRHLSDNISLMIPDDEIPAALAEQIVAIRDPYEDNIYRDHFFYKIGHITTDEDVILPRFRNFRNCWRSSGWFDHGEWAVYVTKVGLVDYAIIENGVENHLEPLNRITVAPRIPFFCAETCCTEDRASDVLAQMQSSALELVESAFLSLIESPNTCQCRRCRRGRGRGTCLHDYDADEEWFECFEECYECGDNLRCFEQQMYSNTIYCRNHYPGDDSNGCENCSQPLSETNPMCSEAEENGYIMCHGCCGLYHNGDGEVDP